MWVTSLDRLLRFERRMVIKRVAITCDWKENDSWWNQKQSIQPRRIGSICRAVVHVAIEVAIPRGEAEGVLADPASRQWAVIAGPIVLQAGLGVELAARVLEAVAERRIALGHHIAEAIVVDVVLHDAPSVGEVSYRAQPVRNVPGYRPV